MICPLTIQQMSPQSTTVHMCLHLFHRSNNNPAGQKLMEAWDENCPLKFKARLAWKMRIGKIRP